MRKNLLLLLLIGLSMSFTSFSLRAQAPVIDGDMSDAAYVSLATYQFGNDGFAGDNDLGELKVYFDGTYLLPRG